MTVDINGLSTKLEVLTSIKENIQDGDTDTAIDMVNQMIEMEPQPEEARPREVRMPDRRHLSRMHWTIIR